MKKSKFFANIQFLSILFLALVGDEYIGVCLIATALLTMILHTSN